MTERNSKKDLEDLPEESPSSRSEELLKLKSVNSKTELKMLYALPELLLMKVLFQEVELLFCMLKELLNMSKEPTLIKILELKLSEKLAKFHARPFAKTLALKDLSLLTSSWMPTLRHTVSMLQ